MKTRTQHSSTRQHKKAPPRRRMSWLPAGLIGLGVLLLIGLLFVFINQAGGKEVSPARIGAILNDFTLMDIEGQKVRLGDYKGKVVLVNAWATWCPPCRAEMPDLNAFYQAHQENGFVVLAVNAGDPLSSAASFAQANDLAFPVLLDPDLYLLDGLGIHSFPTSIVVGRDGRVRTIHVGMYSPEALNADITPLLSE
ncbi:MAG: TlpA family protein disulfide reductase [Anaerolineaceae bacterium]|nr:TlpA family protein disulfide reductase [Anaerolineaceae bacterium]